MPLKMIVLLGIVAAFACAMPCESWQNRIISLHPVDPSQVSASDREFMDANGIDPGVAKTFNDAVQVSTEICPRNIEITKIDASGSCGSTEQCAFIISCPSRIGMRAVIWAGRTIELMDASPGITPKGSTTFLLEKESVRIFVQATPAGFSFGAETKK